MSVPGAEAGDIIFFSGGDVALGSCSSCDADLNLLKRLHSVVLFIVMCVSLCVGLSVPQCT